MSVMHGGNKYGSNDVSAGVTKPLISVVVVTFHSMKGAAISLREMAGIAGDSSQVEWIIIDNSTNTNETNELCKLFGSSATVKTPESNLGFAGGVNRGARESAGEWLLLVNPDVHLTSEGFEQLVESVSTLPESVVVAAPILEVGGTSYQGIEFRWGVWFADRPLGSRRPPIGPTGGLAILRRKWFLDMGGLNEEYFAWGEDAEFSLRVLESGYECPGLNISFHHDGGHSVTDVSIARKRAYSLARNRVWIARHHFGVYKKLKFVSVWFALFPIRAMRNSRRRTLLADVSGFLDGWGSTSKFGGRYVW